MSTAKLVKDIYLGSGSSNPRVLGSHGSNLYFFANDNSYGYELWKTDGTEAGTVLVKDINPGASDSLDSSFWANYDPNLESIGSTLYFGAKGDSGQTHLWKTDGTEEGTVRVKNFETGTSPHNLTAVGNTLYFCIDDGTHGFELWKTDGTESGTLLVKDINQQPGNSSPSDLTVIGETLYFTANDGINGKEVWKTDGTDSGTVLVKDIYSGSWTSSPNSLTAVGNTLYFTAQHGTPISYGADSVSTYLWKTDGTESGTVEIDTPNNVNYFGYFGSSYTTPSELTSFGNVLYFSAHQIYDGTELWKTDGTISGTSKVKDIDTGYGHVLGSFPQSLTVVGNTLYFTAGTGYLYNNNNRELWKTDGTEAGTVLVKDIYPGSDGSNPSNLTAVGNTLYFTANDGTNGTELWKTDGTEAGTVLVQNLTAGNGNSALSDMTAIGDTLYFTYDNGSNGKELWSVGPNNTPTDIGITSSIFNENIAAGSIVTNLTTTDIDTGNSHTYTLVNGSGSTDNSTFTISGNSLKINTSPDFESKSSYSIRLQTDDGEGGTYQEAFTLSVNNLNETPSNISLSSSSFNENIESSSTVATLSASDPDSSDTHSYALVIGSGDNDNSSFIIDGSSLKIKASPDYETKSSYNLRILTIDSGGETYAKAFTLSVNDLNEFVATISGTAGNDSLLSTSSNDFIDGGEGTDTVSITGYFSNYSFTRSTDTLQISDQRTTGTTDGTDTLKNIEYIQFSDQTVEESKVDVVKTYTGNFHDYKFYDKGNGKYEIKTDSGYDDITGYPSLQFTGEATTSSFRDVSAIADIKGTFDQVTGLNTDDAKMFRLYNAAFKRLPDSDGLKYWISQYSSGANDDRTIASSFLVSAEFKQRYGEDVTNAKYVETLYTNVLGRDYDQEGYNYWLGNLNNGTETRYELLLGFAESAENKALFTEMTGFG